MQLTPATISALNRCLTLPSTAELLDKSENQTRKLAQKAIKDGRLVSRADGVWRGWLGMNGEVRESKLPPAGLSSSSFLPDEPPLTAPETPSAPAEQVFDVRPRAQPLAGEYVSVLERLRSLPADANYADIVQRYRDGRTMKDSHAALRRFVISHAHELPVHVVQLVAPTAEVPVTNLTYGQLDDRLTKQEEKVEQLAAIVQVLGMEMDLLTEEEPPFSPAQLLWPAVGAWSLTRSSTRRIIAVARRVPRAVERFVDIIRGKEF